MPGTVTLSLDAELAWGHLDFVPLDPVIEGAEYTASVGFRRLLDALDRRGLSATWACVGAMLSDGLKVELPEARVNGRIWEHPVPADGTEATAPAFFGPSLLQALLEAKTPQEIGFHGFSHLSFLDPAMTAERADAELAACRALSDELELNATSFVFPRNHIGHLDALRRHGFTCYRALDAQRIPTSSTRIRLAEGLASDWLCLAPVPARPTVDRGLVALPGSTLLSFAAGRRRRIPDFWRIRRLRRGIRKAARTGGVFHPWLHPINLYPEPERRFAVVEAFLDDLARARDRGDVQVKTMGEVAADML